MLQRYKIYTVWTKEYLYVIIAKKPKVERSYFRTVINYNACIDMTLYATKDIRLDGGDMEQ